MEKKLNFQIVIQESANYLDFYPFTVMHCVWEIRCGALRIFEKIKANFAENPISFRGRNLQLSAFLKKENIKNEYFENFPTLFIYSNAIFDENSAEKIKNSINFENEKNILFESKNGEKLAFFTKKSEFNFAEKIDFNSISCKKISLETAKTINFLWETLDFQFEQINEDAKFFKSKILQLQNNDKNYKNFINSSNILFGENCKIDAGVILDASNGAIIIDDEARIMYNSVIIGPCYIGKKTLIKIGSKIYENCSFGENCKIGGEIECSIFHNFSNKQHDGFLGHSYICEWVNLGAGTNNSDLKNNYSKISIELPHKKVETNKQFLGLMMGDHSKTSINSAFSTGSTVGISAMISNSKLPKFISSFSWLNAEISSKYILEKAIETAKQVMKRRNKELTVEEIELLKQEYFNK